MFRRIIAAVIVVAVSQLGAVPSYAASSTFYLSLKANTCYSFTANATKPAQISNPSKTMYAVSCTKPHHFQVIKIGQVPAAGSSLTQDDMSAYCSAAYKAVYKEEPPQEISNGARYLRWFFPDPGAETRKYKNTGVCIVHKSNADYTVYSVVKSKI